MSKIKIIVALDFKTEHEVMSLVEKLDPAQCRVKVGKELFTYLGPSIVNKLSALGFDVFLDLKFHDIPNTVANACVAAADMGVWMINVHAQGGQKMMAAAKNELIKLVEPPKLIAVTVLTSMTEDDLCALGHNDTPQVLALKYADLAYQSGLDGVVCSAQEAPAMRAEFGEHFDLVTPGIRPAGSAKDDQQRIMTPKEAIANGSSYLVMGRPITQSEDPVAVVTQMLNDIEH